MAALVGLVLLAMGSVTGCGKTGGGNQKGMQAEEKTFAGTGAFAPPEVPLVLTDAQARADYLALHWWDSACLFNSSITIDTTMIESALPDWLDVLHYTSDEGLGKAVDHIATQTACRKEVYRLLYDLVERYLYDPNSPMRDEELFDRILARIEASPSLDEADKVRPRFLRGQLAMNRPGTRAADFVYELPSGKRSSLSGIGAEYLILYFYNPDCHECRTLRGQLAGSPAVAALTARGRLKILALYPDKDLAAWRRYQSDIPAGWINAFDPHGRVKDELYAIRAIPTLYLLGRDKTVVLKDVSFGRIEAYLMQVPAK